MFLARVDIKKDTDSSGDAFKRKHEYSHHNSSVNPQYFFTQNYVQLLLILILATISVVLFS